MQQTRILHPGLQPGAGDFAVVARFLSNRFEGSGEAGLKFVEIGDIVYEGQGAAFVHETQLRQVAHGTHHGGGERVEAGIGGGKGPVDTVGQIPVLRIVVAALPGDAFLAPELRLERTDS